LSKILVTGGSGLAGRSLQVILSAKYLSSSDYDFRNQNQTQECFKRYEPKIVIHLAGKVGGILANVKSPYDFYYDNIMMNTNVLHACAVNKVEYILAIAGTVMYPLPPQLPITEEMIHTGMASKNHRGYSYAKRMLQVQLDCANAQYGIKSSLLIPGGLYGPYDHFHEEKGHVVPTLLKRIHDAKINQEKFVECYGTGKPIRQFTYAKDLANAIVQVVEKRLQGEYNICNPEGHSIAELIRIIVETVGYKGEIRFNNKLDGILRNEASDAKIQAEIRLHYTSLEKGLKLTYDWYKEEIG